MKDFLKTRTFISICIIAVLLLGMMAVSAADSGRVTIFEDIAGIIITPIQNLCTTVSSKSGDFIAVFTEFNEMKEENVRLKEELAATAAALRDSQEYKLENESLKGILGIKEENPDFTFEPALIVADDRSGYSHTLTLNKGSLSNIKKRDVIITEQGLVGYVTEVGSTWCRAITILDASCEIGALVTRTQDIGVLEGDYELQSNGNCKVSYLSNEVQLNSGDGIVTSGIGGTFPGKILIGNVIEIKPEAHGISQYAVIEPAVNFDELKNVFVITGFAASAGESEKTALKAQTPKPRTAI